MQNGNHKVVIFRLSVSPGLKECLLEPIFDDIGDKLRRSSYASLTEFRCYFDDVDAVIDYRNSQARQVRVKYYISKPRG